MTNNTPNPFTISIGPQHPALKEPAHFQLELEGEQVVKAQIRLGYVHRGIEKATEGRSWVQSLYLLERICGICSHTHATTYCLGVEELASVTAPPRAQAIRTLLGEMERIHSHLLWLGVAAHDAGFDTLFMYSWRDRETIMDLLEQITGNRVNYSANQLGGVKVDLTPEQHTAILHALDFLEERTLHYIQIVTTDGLFVQRTQGVGVMSHKQATAWGVIGPTARASNVRRDIRLDAPYVFYRDLPIPITLEATGDLLARFVVRLRELLTTYDYIRQLLEHFPTGELLARMPRKIPAGEAISRVEAPRGELFYFIKSSGTDHPDRIKVRTPTLCNLASVAKLIVGQTLADVPMILVGVDPCFSCNDRQILLTRSSTDQTQWSWEQLRQYGIQFYGGKRG